MAMILIIMMTSFVLLVKANVSIQQKLQWRFIDSHQKYSDEFEITFLYLSKQIPQFNQVSTNSEFNNRSGSIES
jgi:hypothetical protein